MDAITAEKLSQMPEEMLAFTLESALQRAGPRVGNLALRGRPPIATPGCAGITSRGVVPHLSQDNVAKHTRIESLYFGLEDFIEKQAPRSPPIYTTPLLDDKNGSRLRAFTAHSQKSVLILGPRRYPAVESPLSNSNDKLAICTSVGFRQLDVDEYVSVGAQLQPDILLAPGDIVTEHKPSQKRAEKMGDRTAAWLRDTTAFKQRAAEETGQGIALFAPVLPIPMESQSWYLRELAEDFKTDVDGLYVHDAQSLVDLPESLRAMPRLAFSSAKGPSGLLYEISLGVDVFLTTLIGAATDAGIALTFTFPAPGATGVTARRPIGLSMWDPEHATDLAPFAEGCECYACRKHHRAFLHHLLSAKEMLAWALLQMHNYHVIEQFFAAVRTSISKGTFEGDRAAFDKYYEPELPITAGQGPRIRGYQFKSVGRGEPKKNSKAFNKFDNMAEALAEAESPSPGVDASELEDHGLGKVQ